MKSRLLLAVSFVVTVSAFAAEPKKISPTDAAKLVADGKAILVDVREPGEWAQTGVAKPAVLLPKSDFDGAQKQWKDFLASVGDKEVVLYCSHGIRAGKIAAKLNEQGVKAASAGRLQHWIDAGLPTRTVDAKK